MMMQLGAKNLEELLAIIRIKVRETRVSRLKQRPFLFKKGIIN